MSPVNFESVDCFNANVTTVYLYVELVTKISDCIICASTALLEKAVCVRGRLGFGLCFSLIKKFVHIWKCAVTLWVSTFKSPNLLFALTNYLGCVYVWHTLCAFVFQHAWLRGGTIQLVQLCWLQFASV